ncbi:hypothetical protein [Microbacterium sp. CPCC 204701]|uniref:hypothetical protein n=1 Tax=Microbacterium sp. CPCC 204701 TaxID=2493084 RepID=UPI000FD78DDE|nr:hypothetical protein [Microbacterium sp. CPCC 204701]
MTVTVAVDVAAGVRVGARVGVRLRGARSDDGSGLRGEAVAYALDQGGVVGDLERRESIRLVDHPDIATHDRRGVPFVQRLLHEALCDHLEHGREPARRERARAIDGDPNELIACVVVVDRVAEIVDPREVLP